MKIRNLINKQFELFVSLISQQFCITNTATKGNKINFLTLANSELD